MSTCDIRGRVVPAPRANDGPPPARRSVHACDDRRLGCSARFIWTDAVSHASNLFPRQLAKSYNPYGFRAPLVQKRAGRNFHMRSHGYHVGAPEISELLEWCLKNSEQSCSSDQLSRSYKFRYKISFLLESFMLTLAVSLARGTPSFSEPTEDALQRNSLSTVQYYTAVLTMN